jgi:undecaprenyl-diphosphatase
MVLMIAFCIGLAQTFALLPGISRSGITISVALIMGIQHQKAAKFAFFMAIPVLLGAGFLQVISFEPQINFSTTPLIVGFISSAVTGYLVISWLLDVISRGKFYLFSLYCFVVSFLAFTFIS